MEQEHLCEEHRERLCLFCENDGQLICWCCERKPEHQGHVTVLAAEACQGYRQKFQETVTKLRKLKDKCEALKLYTREKIIKQMENIEIWRKKIQSDFKKFHMILYEEEKSFLWKLENGNKQILQTLQANEGKLEKQTEELTHHISELERKCQSSAQNLLQGVTETLDRSSAMLLTIPEYVSVDIHMKPNISELYFDMKKILENYQVDVTLDSDTAHNDLHLSKNQTLVTGGLPQMKVDTPRRFRVSPCVLGCEAFTSGRHYFEVSIENGTEWDVGVCLENVSRDCDLTLMPQSGFWAIRRCMEHGYVALTSPLTLLYLQEVIGDVGVFLECEAGLVSFYNVRTGSHIFTFSQVSFSQPLRPYFRIGKYSSLCLTHIHKQCI